MSVVGRYKITHLRRGSLGLKAAIGAVGFLVPLVVMGLGHYGIGTAALMNLLLCPPFILMPSSEGPANFDFFATLAVIGLLNAGLYLFVFLAIRYFVRMSLSA
jgi:hypothetical protein